MPHDRQPGVGQNSHIPPPDPSTPHYPEDYPLLHPTLAGHSSSSTVSSPQPLTAAAATRSNAAALCLLVFSLHNGWNCFVFLNYVNYSPARALLNATDPEIG